MEKGKVADTKPVMTDVSEGKSYAWCSCGLSDNQPWCNGSHRKTDLTPEVFKAEDNKKVAMCMCKQTSNPPFCDGSHNNL